MGMEGYRRREGREKIEGRRGKRGKEEGLSEKGKRESGMKKTWIE